VRLIAVPLFVLACLIVPLLAAGQTLPPKDKADQALEDILRNKSSPRAPSTGTPSPPTRTSPPTIGTQHVAPPALASAVREKLRPCWNTLGLKSVTIVPIMVQMGRDARPMRAEPVDKAKYANDPDYRAAADAALRAVRNERCHPWPLPLDKYESWQTITLNFDSRS
jgi:hypothetical protein